MFDLGSCVRCERPVLDGSGSLCDRCLTHPDRADGSDTVTDPGRVMTATADVFAPPRRARTTPPGYTLLRYLAGGGMGEVWLARDPADREVALKFLRQGDPASLARFAAEVKALGRVTDPGIIRLHGVELRAADPFFTMEYAPGGSVEGLLARSGRVPPAEAARIVGAAARAVDAAHRANVVHRDIKPSNLLFAAGGVVKVSDFGLAKRLDAGDGATLPGVVVGTYSYMAPEQAAGRGRDATPAADVYALGATLYALLTGAPPFRGTTLRATLGLIETAAPPPMRAGKARVCRRLEAVCRLCLQKNPARRYPSAAALADDLAAWAAGGVMLAKPAGRVRRAAYAVKARRKTVAGAGSAMALAVGAWAMPWPAPQPPGPVPALEAKAAEAWPTDGTKFVLVNKAGVPHQPVWVTGTAGLEPNPADPTGAPLCQFQTNEVSLLQLAPAGLVGDRYELSAEVHRGRVGTGLDPEAGVYVGLNEERDAATDLPARRFVRLAFFDLPPVPGAGRGSRAPSARFGTTLVVGRPNTYPSVWLGLFQRHPVVPAEARPWRGLVVKVSEAGVRAGWRDDPGAPTVWLKDVTAGQIEQAMADSLAEQNRRAPPHAPPAVLPRYTWAPGGPIGVYTRSLGVSVQNLTVERTGN